MVGVHHGLSVPLGDATLFKLYFSKHIMRSKFKLFQVRVLIQSGVSALEFFHEPHKKVWLVDVKRPSRLRDGSGISDFWA